ncbi:hypothetical protein SAMN05216288_0447 [Pseudomonas punonensis]|uniref:Uncharacterized protein n=1 Tax=Phytopseudomonas punonensis TaxID=1220495 RepID=A0A1M7NRB9_9GAMM|nr:hypothetical protein SAMN05216288_0447 [Pseudomonas punonensis]
MIVVNVVINVTGCKKESIRPEVGDRPEAKRVNSGAKWKVAVIAAVPWVGKLLHYLFGDE